MLFHFSSSFFPNFWLVLSDATADRLYVCVDPFESIKLSLSLSLYEATIISPPLQANAKATSVESAGRIGYSSSRELTFEAANQIVFL